MPLRISKFSFSRDVFFYAVSIGMIYWVLHDNTVTIPEAIGLILGGTVYSTFVGFSSSIRGKCLKQQSSGLERQVSEGSCSAASIGPSAGLANDVTVANVQLEKAPAPEEGCFLGVRVQMANRMQDRFRHWDSRFVTLSKEALVVSTDVREPHAGKYGRTARGIVFQRDSK